jgi:excinuclease UvrABC nuclease subunit
MSNSALGRGRLRKADSPFSLPTSPGIYRIVTKNKGDKNYIGVTNNLYRRLNEHRRSGKFNDRYHRIEYGETKSNASWLEIALTEIAHIAKHKPTQNKYKGGNGRH